MADDSTFRNAVDTAWFVFRTAHEDIDEADSRHCLLERYLHGRLGPREVDVEELANVGLAYLARLPEDEY